MIKSVLLCTDGSDYSNTAADYALLLAKSLRARITALHVIDIRLLEGPYLADVGGVLGAQPYQAIVPQIQEIQQEKSELIMSALAKKLGAKSADFVTDVKTGSLVGTILEREAGSDLVVLGKRGEHARYGDDVIGSSVEWIVRKSSKPCLVTPETFRPIKKVIAAYDGSSHSEKALRTALDLVEALKLPLAITTVVPGSDDPGPWQGRLDEGSRVARDRGVSATTTLLQGHPDEKIASHCRDEEADLLVIGAYGHSRIREFLLGSTTFQILLKANIPVWMIR